MMNGKTVPNIVTTLLLGVSIGCSADFFEYGVSQEIFTIEVQSKPNEVYYVEESTNLDVWTLVQAESSNDPEMKTTFSEPTSADSSKFFRLTRRPLEETVPLLTEFSFKVGFFHTQSDTHHRLRYHTAVEMWNPYKFDIELAAESAEPAYWLVIENLPVVTVEVKRGGRMGLETALGFSIDLNNFPDQYPHNSTIESLPWDWVFVENHELPSGEVYMTTTELTQGLARTIASENDRWSWETTFGPRFPVLYADDDVEISAVPCKITVHLIPFRGFTDDSVRPLDLGDPLLTLRDIPFDGFKFTLLGSEYSRTTSSSYAVNDFDVAYHFKLKDPAKFEELLLLLTPTEGVIDFSDEEVATKFEINADPLELASIVNAFSPYDTFFDQTANSQNAPREPLILVD